MKLLFFWVNNYKNMIINQAFRICNGYNISFDKEKNTLQISKNRNYIENFYGQNILDITALVGKNGTGKTTVAKFIYDNCESVHPCENENDSLDNEQDGMKIFVYEEYVKSPKIIVYYNLNSELILEENEDIDVVLINLKGISGTNFESAEKLHNMTTVYFTNSFEINDVMRNQGFGEFSIYDTHKSLCYSPMLSLQRSSTRLKTHYGATKTDDGMILDVINQYAQKMTSDFKTPYASANGLNFLTATRVLPNSIATLLPVMNDFEIEIVEFGEYMKFITNFLRESPYDMTVFFVRKNIYEHLSKDFENYWDKIYLNVICEIVLFLNLFNTGYKNVNFEVLESENINLNEEEALDRILMQIEDKKENKAKIELIRKIRKVKGVDLSVIKDFIELDDPNSQILKQSKWYEQIMDFYLNYKKIKEIQIAKTVNYGYTELIDFLVENYRNINTVYGRMIMIVPHPMSSGEVAMINVFSSLYSALNEKTCNNILLILDEIDAFLHPKWQQEILMHISRWINESERFNNKKVQILIATHSPIVLSDIPGDKVIYLNSKSNVFTEKQLTFGANISSLFYESFSLKQGSIGKIAQKEIQWALDNAENKNLDVDEKRRFCYIVGHVGDRFLREKLKTSHIYIAYSEGDDENND